MRWEFNTICESQGSPGSLLQGEDDHSITGLAAQSIAKCLDLSICVDVVDRKPLLCSRELLEEFDPRETERAGMAGAWDGAPSSRVGTVDSHALILSTSISQRNYPSGVLMIGSWLATRFWLSHMFFHGPCFSKGTLAVVGRRSTQVVMVPSSRYCT